MKRHQPAFWEVIATTTALLLGCGGEKPVSIHLERYVNLRPSNLKKPSKNTNSKENEQTSDRALARYYVSPNGDDNAEGSLEKPLRTVSRCANLVVPGDTCVLRAGIYRETLSPLRSGTAKLPIKFEAYPGEVVEIRGADPVAGFVKHQGSVWRTQLKQHLGHETQVLVGGERMWQARWPNLGSFAISEHSARRSKLRSATSTTLTDDLLDQPDGFWTGATVHLVGGYGKWLGQTTTVTGSNRAKRTLTVKPFAISDSVLGPAEGSLYFLSGVLGALDAPREWHLDEQSSTLYLWSPDSSTPRDVEVQTRRTAIDLSGRTDIVISNIDVRVGLVLLVGSSRCTLEKMHIRYPYSSSRAVEKYKSQLRTGVVIEGDDNVVRASEIAGSSGSGVFLKGNRNRVINSYIHDFNQLGTYAAGVYVSPGGLDNVIYRTTFAEFGRAAVHQNGSGTRISYNDIYNGMRMTRDGGAIYGWGTDHEGARIDHNFIHDLGMPGDRSAVGVYFDNFDLNGVIDHNVIYNINGNGITINSPQTTALVFNNTVHNVSNVGLAFWGEAPYEREWYQSRIFNNIFPPTASNLPGCRWGNNLINPGESIYENASKADFRLRKGTPALDAGVRISGITDGFTGSAPDIGALEYGQTAWKYGVDFNSVIEDPVRSPQPSYLSLVKNGAFSRGLEGWTPIGNAKATTEWPNFNTQIPADKRGFSHRLKLSDGQGGVQQKVKLAANTRYLASAMMSRTDGESVTLSIKGYGGPDLYVNGTSSSYDGHKELRFTTGSTAPTVSIIVWKHSLGAAPVWADDVILVPLDK